VVFLMTSTICRSLSRSRVHPLRAWQGEVVRRRADGGIETIAESPDRVEVTPTEPPVGTVPGHDYPKGAVGE
jgi:hypothetical protein